MAICLLETTAEKPWALRAAKVGPGELAVRWRTNSKRWHREVENGKRVIGCARGLILNADVFEKRPGAADPL